MKTPDYEGSRSEMLKLLADNDMPPAFIERARRTEAAADQVHLTAAKEREELLEMPRLRLGVLAEMIRHDWTVLAQHVTDNAAPEYLQTLHQQWQPVLRVEVAATDAPRKLRRAVSELAESFHSFNRKWKKYVEQTDYTAVNEAREGYNKFYIVEKAAAFDSEWLAREGFEELERFTEREVLERLPYLIAPTLKDD